MPMKVSVVVAIYNSEPFIRSCLEGLKAQTFKDFETILVVDSRSTDDSIDVAEKLSPEYAGTKLIIQKDDGRAGGARNLGMDASIGEYIWFLDVDDYFSDTFLEEMISLIEKNNTNMAVCNFFYSKKRRFIDPPDRDYRTSVQNNYEAMIELNTGRYSTNLFNKLISSKLIKDNKIRMSPRYCEDYEFLRDCFECPCTVIYCNKPLYTYILSEGTRSYKEGNQIAEEDIRIFDGMMEWINKSDCTEIKQLYESGLTHILRSLTNTDEDCYYELIHSDTIKNALKYSRWASPEIMLFKFSKNLFYVIGCRRRIKKFSNEVFLYDRCV